MELSRKGTLIEEINSVGEFDEKDRGVAPVSYSDAVKRLKKKEQEVEDACAKHREETLKGTEEMNSTEDSRVNQKVIKTDDLKKMHLSESLFEEWEEEDEEEEEVEEETCECEKIEEAVDIKLDELKDMFKDILKNHLKLKKDKIDSVLDKVNKDTHHDNIYEAFLGRLALGDAQEVVEKLKSLDSLYVLDSYGPGYIKVAFKKDFEKDPFVETPLTEEAELSDKDKVRDYFVDSILAALDNIFTAARAYTKVNQVEKEFDPLVIDNAIGALADVLTDAYLGLNENLSEAKSKHDTVIRAALRRKDNENKKLTEDLNADQPESKGVADLINELIIDEFEAITGYNNAITTITSIDPESTMLNVLNDIINEENTHVGQLQAALKEVSEAANNIMSGNNEGEGQLGNPEVEVQEPEVEEKSSFEDEHIG